MSISNIYGTVSDKVKSVIFAKKLAEEAAAKEARKRRITIICICAGVALVAVGIGVGIYFLSKNQKVRDKFSGVVAKIKGKLPCNKCKDEQPAEEFNFEDYECECEVVSAHEEE